MLKKIHKYLPHVLISDRALNVIWRVFFYATLVFLAYALINWVRVLCLPADYWQVYSAPLKQIYGFAAGAAFLLCLAEAAVLRVLAVLNKAQETLIRK